MAKSTMKKSIVDIVPLLLLSLSSTVQAQSLWDFLFPCEAPTCLLDPCEVCANSLCETIPTSERTGLLGWRICPGCPVLSHCKNESSICCDLIDACPNCICCSDGQWWAFSNNSTSQNDTCKEQSLFLGPECQYFPCTKDLMVCPDDSVVGRDFTDPNCPFRPCPGI